MIRILRLGLLALLAATSGCAHYYARQPDLAQKVDSWIAAREYQRAVETLRLVRPDHPDYSTLMAKQRALKSLLKGYEEGIAAQAEELADQGLLAEALGVYRRGLDILPDSEVLERGRAALLARRDRRLATLRMHLLLAEGRSLVDAEPIQQEIVRIEPGDAGAREKLGDFRDKAQTTAKILLYEGEQALTRGEYDDAARYLETARALHDTEAVQAALGRLKHARARLARSQRQARQRQAQEEHLREQARQAQEEQARERATAERAKELAEGYREAMRKDDLAGARQHLAALSELRPQSPETLVYRQELLDRIQARVQADTERGRLLYSQGKIEEALAVWTSLRSLAPADKALLAHIKRARRVLDKLDRLSRQPAVIPPGEAPQKP